MDGAILIVNDDDSTEELLISPTSPVAPVAPQNPSTPLRIPATDDSPIISTKKRKRIVSPSPKTAKQPPIGKHNASLDEDDDGATCPICLDHWEMSGDHRLTSLKCGHLFGQSCIRRWLQECATGGKCCPSCKTKATPRDFRYLYAKKLCAVDNTETETLRAQLEEKRADCLKLTHDKNMVDFELQRHRERLQQLQEENEYLRRRLAHPGAAAALQSSQQQRDVVLERLNRLKRVKLFLEKSIDITKEPGCRCMVSSRSDRLLFVSQKSSQNLFPGFGLRYVDVETLKPSNFVHVSAKQIRDLVVTDFPDSQPNFLLTATMESVGRLYDVSSKSLAQTLKPTSGGGPEEQLWCCAADDSGGHVYFGGHRGNVFQFDRRQPTVERMTLKSSPTDTSPVINVAHVPPIAQVLPCGGLLVCTLKEIAFYEFLDSGQVAASGVAMNIEGPFSGLSYDAVNGFVLIMTRCAKNTPSKYLMARFERQPGSGAVTLVVKHKFLGSDVMPVMSRPVQYHVVGTDSVLMTAYLQSTKMLTTWAVENNLKLQSMAVADTILDLCSVHVSGVRHVAALTETKCRIFKIHEERG